MGNSRKLEYSGRDVDISVNNTKASWVQGVGRVSSRVAFARAELSEIAQDRAAKQEARCKEFGDPAVVLRG